MIVMEITLKLAFEDVEGRTAEGVAEVLVEHALDGLGAEVAYTHTRLEKFVPIVDVWAEGKDVTNEKAEAWRELARNALDKLHRED